MGCLWFGLPHVIMVMQLRERLSLMKIVEEEEMKERRLAIKSTKEVKWHTSTCILN